ncbi:unnamed protein product [Protopolystoma xenopodis]|uniref:Uncharacterized protein n=1 Tax=Protopolystoma xenopodis TaxID=117903 RepID=A0A448XG67_9PLAT|nr:unnamed protein product [Protopolystoma xenopodis]
MCSAIPDLCVSMFLQSLMLFAEFSSCFTDILLLTVAAFDAINSKAFKFVSLLVLRRQTGEKKWNISVITKEKKTLFTSLPAQHEKTDNFECSGVYCIKCGTVKQEEKSAYESRNIKDSAEKWIHKDQK